MAMLEKRAGEELFRKHVSTVVAAGLAALAAEQAAAAGKEAPAASAGAAGAAAAAAAAGGAAAQGDGGAGAAAAGSRLLDTMAFLNDLGRWAEGRIITQVLVTRTANAHRGIHCSALAPSRAPASDGNATCPYQPSFPMPCNDGFRGAECPWAFRSV